MLPVPRLHQPVRRAAAWLALLATLMIYAAPLVSQRLVATSPHHSAHHSSHHDAGHHGHHAPATDHHAGHEACGYCTLLGQLWWCVGRPAAAAVAPATVPPALCEPATPLLARGHAPFQPRAPPPS
ncbi:DUF2946 family protein [Oceanimonas sp. MB9]|uniref:DUF2946 family protein n=1 Tax=Oceanimonas sp. MB9 TaxID=2588453 RepID=UPI0013F62C98|nr:DUF2946 family protein [Oceanimonas sp. MB9]NHH99340.1 hypothetical protein [Oceanimonas sp. MB9]